VSATQPDAPAMPQGYVPPEAEGYINAGLTAREHAGIHLLQPTGTPWLDAMIEARRRDELATAALTGFVSNPIVANAVNEAALNVPSRASVFYAEMSLENAEAMLSAIMQREGRQ
jgi:hypothetical protein